jgi:spermidine synthase
MLTQTLFALFVLSGFCGLLYQIVWLRLAFQSFGIITPVLSVVVSVFMLGLALGSWGGGRLVRVWMQRGRGSPIYLYAAAELVIGLSAFAVPAGFELGQRWLLGIETIDSLLYLALSGGVLAVTMLPPCIAMGATFPLMLAFVKHAQPEADGNRFSFLYLANVIGASLGAAITPVALVERFGFRGTLLVAATINFLIGGVSVWLGQRHRARDPRTSHQSRTAPARIHAETGAHRATRLALAILFVTGFTSMGMEVIWTRAFTRVLGTYVYSFAALLFAYLWATWIGSWVYRRDLAAGRTVSTAKLLGLLAVTSLMPVLLNDPRIGVDGARAYDAAAYFGGAFNAALALASIVPFSAVLGYLTPALVDQYSHDEPGRAGRAYAVNVIGCVAGPLAAGYMLLPWIGARLGIVVLSLPFLVLFTMTARSESLTGRWRISAVASTIAMLVVTTFINTSYEDGPPGSRAEIRRDHTATVVSFGEGMRKQLLVNGIGITSQTPVTKLMAHLPLAIHGRADSLLVICFGMGTTYRSAMSWGVKTTAVDLARGVPDAFSYYFDDAAALAAHPNGRIVIDDGRRFLHRNRDTFDVITIDPPPPIEAAGSSLLYSEEFYELLKTRLKPGGILQQWSPGGEVLIDNAIARSLVNSFTYVVAFRSFEGRGVHYTASMSPIRIPSPAEFVAALPDRAKRDLTEWNAGDLRSADVFAERVLGRQISVQHVLNPDLNVVITDDHPFNEYCVLRRAARRIRRLLE